MKVIEGRLIGAGLRFCIVVSRFNSLFSEKLLEGAKDMLLRHDVSIRAIDVVKVPGAWELPLVAKEAALSGKYDAIIALGAVIGEILPTSNTSRRKCPKGWPPWP